MSRRWTIQRVDNLKQHEIRTSRFLYISKYTEVIPLVIFIIQGLLLSFSGLTTYEVGLY